MYAFFNTKIEKKSIYLEYYKELYTTIEKLGFKHIDKSFISRLSSMNKSNEKNDELTYNAHYFHEINKFIKNSNINIFECTVSSLEIGYQVKTSLEYNKPTILFYLKENPPHYLIYETNDKLVHKLVDPKNLEKSMKGVLEDAKKRSDKRFNFFVNPQTLLYIDKASEKAGVTKSQFVRSLIFEEMIINNEKNNAQ